MESGEGPEAVVLPMVHNPGQGSEADPGVIMVYDHVQHTYVELPRVGDKDKTSGTGDETLVADDLSRHGHVGHVRDGESADLSVSFLQTGLDGQCAANGEASRGRVDGQLRQHDALQQPDWMKKTIDNAELWQIILEYVAKKHVWADDQSAVVCGAESCRKNFAATGEWKHHCRMCGLIFCDACAPVQTKSLDPKSPSIKVLAKPSSFAATLRRLFAWGPGVYDRLCSKCHRIYTALHSEKIGARLAESMDRALFRECQYRMPYHDLTSEEKEYLRRNLPLFHGHSKYTVQILLKVIDWSEPLEAAKAAQLLTPSTTDAAASCQQLFCTRACHRHLQPDDALVLLAHLPKSATAARSPLLAVLDGKQCTVAELLCHLPLLVSLLASDLWNEPDGPTMDHSALAQFLLARACRSVDAELLSKLYWLVEVEATSGVYSRRSDYRAMQQQLLLRSACPQAAPASGAEHRTGVDGPAPESDALQLIRTHQLIAALTVHDVECAASKPQKPPLEQAELELAVERSTARVFARKKPGHGPPRDVAAFLLLGHWLGTATVQYLRSTPGLLGHR